MSQSDRAGNRVRDLRTSALDRLRNHSPLTTRLEYVSSITSGDNVIVPSFTTQKYRHDSTSEDPPDVLVSVMVVTGSSTRENRQERANLTVQVGIEMNADTLGTRQDGNNLDIAWHDELRDEISAVLTSHVEGWNAEGESGGTPEPLWDDSIGRYRSVQRFDVSRYD